MRLNRNSGKAKRKHQNYRYNVESLKRRVLIGFAEAPVLIGERKMQIFQPLQDCKFAGAFSTRIFPMQIKILDKNYKQIVLSIVLSIIK
jgi:hypothetical protein